MKPGQLHNAILTLLGGRRGKEGLTQDELQASFPRNTPFELSAALNLLLGRKRLEVYEVTRRDPVTQAMVKKEVFRDVGFEYAERLAVLTPEESAVFHLIEKSGAAGMWIRNLKLQTKLQQVTLNKILKTLEKSCVWVVTFSQQWGCASTPVSPPLPHTPTPHPAASL